MCVFARLRDILQFFLLNSLNLFIDIEFIFFWSCCFFATAAAASPHENVHLVEFIEHVLFRISPKHMGSAGLFQSMCNTHHFLPVCASAHEYEHDMLILIWLIHFECRIFSKKDLIESKIAWLVFFFSSGVRKMALAKRIILLFCTIFFSLACFLLHVVYILVEAFVSVEVLLIE